jgi:hypothetical protein
MLKGHFRNVPVKRIMRMPTRLGLDIEDASRIRRHAFCDVTALSTLAFTTGNAFTSAGQDRILLHRHVFPCASPLTSFGHPGD